MGLGELNSLTDITKNRGTLSSISEYRLLAFLAAAACFAMLINASIQQLQMTLLGGQILVGNSIIKAGILIAAVVGCVLHPTLKTAGIPLLSWFGCILFLILEAIYFSSVMGISTSDIFLTYYDYYFLLLMGPLFLVFRGALSEKTLIRCTAFAFAVCAVVAAAQYLTGKPLLYTKSADGSFAIQSYEFFGQIRVFSLFNSGLDFGFFCAFSGALGVALTRKNPIKGGILFLASALACYVTLTRVCYLMFAFSCIYAVLLTYGKKKNRGRWYPILFLLLGIAVTLYGLNSVANGPVENNLESTVSMLDRIRQWTFYYDYLSHVSFVQLMFGSAIVQIETVTPHYPMIIDNTPLAFILHVGFVGLFVFGVFIAKIWGYLRRESLMLQQPFIIAITSLWSTFLCAGMFAILFGTFGSLFSLVILCESKEEPRLSRTLAVKGDGSAMMLHPD